MNLNSLNQLTIAMENSSAFVGNRPSSNRGDVYKIIAIIFLGLGSFIIGVLPALISNRNLRRFPLTTSFLLCFGAGVLLSTSVVHMLPDVQKVLSKDAEILFCGGFFIVYFIDEFIHYFFGEAIQHDHQKSENIIASIPSHHSHQHLHNHGHGSRTQRTNYGTLTTETQHSQGVQQMASSRNHSEPLACSSKLHCDDVIIAKANARICHTSHLEPCAQSKTGTLGLFVALSLHSLIEGLAIGVQNSSAEVLFLIGAVSCHKFVMSFCLGLELRSNPSLNLRFHFLGILVFAMGSIVGIAIGMLIVYIPTNWLSILPIIQALAGGTLFYITVCEVLPREKARWHQNPERKIAGFSLFLAVAIGFAVMTLIDHFVGDQS